MELLATEAKQAEIISGNDEICRLLEFESNKVYVYKVPNLFPHDKENDTGWIEVNTQCIGFDTDWNMLIGAYNRALKVLDELPPPAKVLLKKEKNFVVNFGIHHFFGLFENQLHISSCWIKLVDFAKWYNSVKLMIKTPTP